MEHGVNIGINPEFPPRDFEPLPLEGREEATEGIVDGWGNLHTINKGLRAQGCLSSPLESLAVGGWLGDFKISVLCYMYLRSPLRRNR